jgi:ribosomal protein L13E
LCRSAEQGTALARAFAEDSTMTWNRDAISSTPTGPVVVRGPKLVRATGYSLRELERAGLTAGDASRLGLPLDRTRLTLLGCNVLQLCALADHPAHAVRGAP